MLETIVIEFVVIVIMGIIIHSDTKRIDELMACLRAANAALEDTRVSLWLRASQITSPAPVPLSKSANRLDGHEWRGT